MTSFRKDPIAYRVIGISTRTWPSLSLGTTSLLSIDPQQNVRYKKNDHSFKLDIHQAALHFQNLTCSKCLPARSCPPRWSKDSHEI